MGVPEDSTALDVASNAYLDRHPFPPSLLELLEELASLVSPPRFNLVCDTTGGLPLFHSTCAVMQLPR